MICPRCSVAEISEETNQCVLCGYAPRGSPVAVEQIGDDPVLDDTRKPLAGRFEIERLIGRGRVSFVYRARDVETNQAVAVKVIRLGGSVDPDLVRRFEREAARAAALRHSHILPALACGTSGTLFWYSMELNQGCSLSEILRNDGALDLERCLRILDQAASALDHAHRRSVIHGNLKPSNILVDEDGWVRVADFGMMRAFGRGASVALGVPALAAPEYMAPEQFQPRGESASADQYALGVIAYECLSGALPFVGDSYEELARMHQEAVPVRLTELREDIPLLIADAVEQALRKRPTDRFANVLDFVTVLRGGPPQTVEPVAAEQARSIPHVLTIDQPKPRVPWLRIGLGAGALLVAVGGVLVGMRVLSRDSSPAAAGDGFVRAWPDNNLRAPPAPVPDSAVAVASGPDQGGPAAPPAERPAPQPEAAAETAVPPPPPPPPRREPAPVTVAAADSARLFIRATPWGALFVDGEFAGNTPQTNLGVVPGNHVLRIEREGYEPLELEVELAAGDELRLTDLVLVPRVP